MASNRFIVDLGDLKVSDAAAKRLNSGIQKLVLEHLASEDRAGQNFAMHFPPDWWGLVARVFDPGFPDLTGRLDKARGELGNI